MYVFIVHKLAKEIPIIVENTEEVFSEGECVYRVA